MRDDMPMKRGGGQDGDRDLPLHIDPKTDTPFRRINAATQARLPAAVRQAYTAEPYTGCYGLTGEVPKWGAKGE